MTTLAPPTAATRESLRLEAGIEVPEDLEDYPQWVGWEYRRIKAKPGCTKVPLRLDGSHTGSPASTTDPSTWASYDVARPHPRIGFVFTAKDPFCGMDLDDCLDPETGEITLAARVILRYCATYAEISPSGRGIKLIVRGSIPEGVSRRQNRKLGVEVYESGRFFTLTGRRLSGVPESIVEADLSPLCRWVFGSEARETPRRHALPDSRSQPRFSDDAIIEKALAAANGARFERLWRGDPSGYPTRSEADLALCAMLAYWSDADARTVETLFSRSGLCREKWTSRPDYRRKTIELAIRSLPHRG